MNKRCLIVSSGSAAVIFLVFRDLSQVFLEPFLYCLAAIPMPLVDLRLFETELSCELSHLVLGPERVFVEFHIEQLCLLFVFLERGLSFFSRWGAFVANFRSLMLLGLVGSSLTLDTG